MIPGKLYECLASKRPVLLLGPVAGDAAILVQKFDGGWAADHEDVKGVKQSLIEWLADRPSYLSEEHKSGKDVSAYRFNEAIDPYDKAFRRYSRRELAREYCHLLDELYENDCGQK